MDSHLLSCGSEYMRQPPSKAVIGMKIFRGILSMGSADERKTEGSSQPVCERRRFRGFAENIVTGWQAECRMYVGGKSNLHML
jgi:hypothetical protein